MKTVYPFSVFPALILSFLLLSGESAIAQAPAFEWAKRTGGASIDFGRAIAADGSGNSYITGSFEGSATFGSTTLSSVGGTDVFIAKYDATGNAIWAQRVGGADPEAGFGIALDGDGNSYVTGYFQGNAVFGTTTLTSSGLADLFVVKLDSAGNVQWAERAGGTEDDFGRAVTIDNISNCYITGSFGNSIAFGNTTLISSGSFDVFVAKYDPSGDPLWAKSVGGTNMESGYGISTDSSGNCYVSGYFQGTALFGSTTLTSSSLADCFVAKIDNAGNVLWARDAVGPADAISLGLATDGSGNSHIVGHFRGSLSLGTDTLTSSGMSDVFLARYDASGNLLWVRKAGGTTDDSGRGIALDGSGNSYITGYFQGNASFGSTTLTEGGGTDVFFGKFDGSGNALWARKAGGTGVDFGLGIAVDGSGSSYTTGFFEGSALFGNTLQTSNGPRDIFLAKLSTITGLSENSTAFIYTSPNPFTISFQFSLPTTEPAIAILADLLGREVHRQHLTPDTEKAQITISPSQNLPSGLYLLQIQQGKEIRQARVLKQ